MELRSKTRTPTLISVVAGTREAMSARARAPRHSIEDGRAPIVPTNGRTRCGVTSPMKPMTPATATLDPTPEATPIKVMTRSIQADTTRARNVSEGQRR